MEFFFNAKSRLGKKAGLFYFSSVINGMGFCIFVALMQNNLH